MYRLHLAVALAAFSSWPVFASTVLLDFSGANVYSTNDDGDGAQTPTGAAAKVALDFFDVGGDVRIQFSVENTTGDTPFGSGATAATLTGFALDFVEDLAVIGAPILGSGQTSALDTLLSNVFIGGISNGGGGAGNFSFALADNDNFQGGNANGGMTATQSAVVSLLFGTTKTAAEISAAYAAALFGTTPTANAALRFQQVAGGTGYSGAGSDKLLFVPPTVVEPPPAPIPLPAAGWLLLGAVAGLAGAKRKRP